MNTKIIRWKSTYKFKRYFFDFSKLFDKVCHKGLVINSKWYEISGNLLKLIENYLTDCLQKVFLTGQTSSWERVLSGVPQGLALGLLFSLIFINDLPDGIQSICKIFVVDTCLFSKCQDFKKSERELNEDLKINFFYQKVGLPMEKRL